MFKNFIDAWPIRLGQFYPDKFLASSSSKLPIGIEPNKEAAKTQVASTQQRLP